MPLPQSLGQGQRPISLTVTACFLNKALGWNGRLWSSQPASPGMETPPYTWKLNGGRVSTSKPLLPRLEPLPHGFGGGGLEMRNAGSLPLPGRYRSPPLGAEGRGSPVTFAPHTQSGASLLPSWGQERGSRSWLKCHSLSFFLLKFSGFYKINASLFALCP